MLLQQLSQLAADKDRWPVVICLEGAEAQQMQADGMYEQLHQQIQQLHKAVTEALGPVDQCQCGTSGQAHCQSEAVAGGSTEAASQPGAECAVAAGSSMRQQASTTTSNSLSCNPQQCWLPNIQLGKYPDLPAMPTLNGLLLEYPAVYCVRDYEGAAAASRVLSASELKLHRVVATSGPQLSAFLESAASPGSQKAAGAAVANAVVLMSFTVPDTVDGAVVEERVQQTLRRLQGKREQGSRDMWQSVRLFTSWVGPQAVSL